MPPSPFPTSPGLKALPPEVLRRERTDQAVSAWSSLVERGDRETLLIHTGHSHFLSYLGLLEASRGRYYPQFTGKDTTSQEDKVYLPGGTRTNKSQSLKANAGHFETNAPHLPLFKVALNRGMTWQHSWLGREWRFELLNKGCLGKGMLSPMLLRITGGSKLRSRGERDDSSILHMAWVFPDLR